VKVVSLGVNMFHELPITIKIIDRVSSNFKRMMGLQFSSLRQNFDDKIPLVHKL